MVAAGGSRPGLRPADVERIWEVLKAFASFGFCKAHAAAFALPTYQSAWLKAHHPAAFLAGVLTHDPGMYPKRLILDDARSLGIAVLGLDVNASDDTYRVEKVASWDEPPPAILDQLEAGPAQPDAGPRPAPPPDLPDGRAYGIRLSLADVKGISAAEVAADRGRSALPLAGRLLAPRPGLPAGRRAAGHGRRLRQPLRPGWAGRPAAGAPPRPGHPPRPAAAGGRAGQLDPGHRALGPQRCAAPAQRRRRRSAAARPARPVSAGAVGTARWC